MKSYHARNVKGTQIRGGFFEMLDKDLSKAAEDLKSEQGGITFLSGALMGMFAAPAGYLSGKVSSYLTQGGINKNYDYLTNRKEYKAKKVTLETQRLEKAKRLTEFFNDNKNFIDGFYTAVSIIVDNPEKLTYMNYPDLCGKGHNAVVEIYQKYRDV